ncbi:basic amino acid/polyamine antiporter [Vagococcus zengguangii]|uniref:Amino acid permease n=1 Tax=Vagococcus zengguangii TaxID=2571750 RepID=A0A4D7CU82_9ENTE|nr:basic amino acid/polyamine antiporter [Vagococcus zengguangii]QCI86853.1 amino acid permease [Vagococcus zengguangii]TLG80459.1 amino acid permease [Vagococcus zengguangii]
MENTEKKIGLFSLIGIIISAIVGAGIFSLMKEMANTASAGVTILGWVIAGVGMGSLAFCLENLNSKRPDLDSGIFSYAQEGFGEFMGFNSVWGYWISVIIGNVAFGTLLFSALGYFFPVFEDGQNIPSIIGASIILWLMHFLILRGLDKATLLNTSVMIAKMVPIAIFIVCVIAGFKLDVFTTDFWGNLKSNGQLETSILEQLKGTVLVTVWVFIGVEGAVVFSGRAKKRSDVGKATILGFASVTIIYAIVTVFSYGVMSQAELKSLPNPAMAYVLESLIGKPGAIIVNLGVIISIFGSWMANTLLAEEVAYQAGTRELFPKLFTKENKNDIPINSVIITNLIVQFLLLSFLVTDEAYTMLSKLSSSTILLPYTCVALFQVKLTASTKDKRIKNWLVGIIASIYMFWVLYASGSMYLVLTVMALLPGSIMYIYVKRKNGETIFKNYEKVIFILFIALFVYGLINFKTLVQL